MTDSKTIDLIIRAQLEGKGDLKKITEGIKDLERALSSQADAAKKGESSIDDLRATLSQLENVYRSLKADQSLTKEFETLPGKIKTATTSVDRAKKSYENLAAEQAKSTKVSEAQIEQLARLGQRYENAQTRLTSLNQRQAELRTTLQALGADTENLADFQAQLTKAIDDSAGAYSRGRQIQDGYAETIRQARVELKAMADAQAQAAADASMFAAAEAKAAAASKARSDAYDEYVAGMRRLREEAVATRAQFDQQRRDEEAQAARTKELTRMREDATAAFEQQAAAEARAAKDSALAKTADDAEQAAKGYRTLAVASSDLRPKLVSIKTAVESIINPAKATGSTLEGVEGQIRDLARTVDSINGPLRDYRETMAQLSETRRSLSTQAGLIDSYNKQNEVLRQAQEAFDKAETQVREYAAAVRQGGEAAEQFVKPLAEALARAQQASQALQNQVGRTNEYKAALGAAGIATNDLSNAQARLIAASKQGQAAVEKLTAAYKQHGAEAEATGKKSKKGIFGDEGRTTLSLAQRIRGEVLALTASYVGLQGAIGFAGDSLKKFNERAASRGVIGVGLGTIDRKAIDAEINYVKDQADRIGVIQTDAVKNFGKLMASAGSAVDPREVKVIFESFTEAGKVINLSADELNGVFVALGQIYNKQKISAEELTSQLGERLPAVFKVAQEAVKDTYPDLIKAMEQGKVGSDALLKIAQKYREYVGSQLPAASKDMAAQQARMTNAVNDFKLAVADAGFADAYVELLGTLTDFFKSDDGKKFAQEVGGFFKGFVEILRAVAQNADLVGAAFSFLAKALPVIMLANTATKFKELYETAKLAEGGIKGFIATTSKFTKGAVVITALIALYEALQYLVETFPAVRLGFVLMASTMDKGVTKIKYAWLIFSEELPNYISDALTSVENLFKKMAKSVIGVLADLFEAVGADSLAKQARIAMDTITFGKAKAETAKAKALRDELKGYMAEIKAAEDSAIADYASSRMGKMAGPAKTVAGTKFDGDTLTPRGGKDDGEKTAKALAQQQDSIENRLEALRARVQKSDKDSLKSQQDAVDSQLKDLEKDINAFGGKSKAALLATFTTLKSELKAQIQENYVKVILDEEADLQVKLEQMDAAAGRKSGVNMQARLEAIDKQYAEAFRRADELIAKQNEVGADTSKAVAIKGGMTDAVTELKQLEAKKVFEEQINQVLSDREARVAAVRAQVEAGALAEADAAVRINEINAASLPTIEAIRLATVEWAAANASIFANPEQQMAFIATMDAVAVRASNVKTEFTSMQKGVADLVDKSLDSVFDNLEQIATGQKSVSQGFKDMAKESLMFFAKFIKDIAIATLKLMIFNAMKNSGIPGVSQAGAAGAANVKIMHSGGTVGSPGGRSRAVSPEWFTAAPRYHEGGIAGLAPDEYATILQKNEQVLTADDPLNIRNRGSATPSQAQSPGTRFVLLDDRTKVPDAMNSAEGEKVILQVLQRNAPTVKQFLG